MTSSFQSRLGTAPEEAIKAPCRVATTANITLSGTQTIDGIAVEVGDRVFVKDQTTGSEDGIYIVQTGSWTRAPDWDGPGDVVSGMLVPIVRGTVSASLIYMVVFSGSFTVGSSSFDTQISVASFADLQSTDAGKGASLVSFEDGKNVQELRSEDAGDGASMIPFEDGKTVQDLRSSDAGKGASMILAEDGVSLEARLPVDNLKELVDATALQVDGLQVQMRAFYSDTDTGGGHFYWDADRAKSDANGGTIVDPDNVGTLSATALGTFASQQGTGSGTGCWVRIVTDVITYADFGLEGESGSEAIVALGNIRDWSAANSVPIFDDGNEISIDDSLKGGARSDLELHLRHDTAVILSDTPTDDADGLKYIERFNGGDFLLIEGGKWDANGFLDSAARAGVYLDPVMPNVVLRRLRVVGDFGPASGGSNVLGASILMRNPQNLTELHSLLAELNHIDGLNDSNGRGIVIAGLKSGVGGFSSADEVVAVTRVIKNIIEGVDIGSTVQDYRAAWVDGNIIDAGDRGILSFGPKSLVNSESDNDQSSAWPLFATFNRIHLDSGAVGQGGIVFGIASGPNLALGNTIYSDSTSTSGISCDTPEGSLTGPYEARTRSVLNVIRGHKTGIQHANSTKSIIALNHISHANEHSIIVSGSRSPEYQLIESNSCEDKPIFVGGGSSENAGKAPIMTMIGRNNLVFRGGDIIKNEETIVNEGINTQSPTLNERFTPSDLPTDRADGSSGVMNKGVAAPIWEFDTESGAIDTYLPQTQRLYPGQNVYAMRFAGTNTITLKPSEGEFVDTDVNTTNNTINVNNPSDAFLREFGLFDESANPNGRPVRISNRDSGTLPGGLTADRIYYLIFVSGQTSGGANGKGFFTIKLADTEADALAGTAVSLTSTGDSTTKYLGDILYDTSRASVASVTVSEMERFLSGRGCWYQL